MGLVVLFGLPILIFFLCWRPKLIVARYGRKGAIRAWWREISDVLPHYDNMFQRRGGETATMYARRIGSLVSTPVCTFDQLVRVVIRAYYTPAEPSDVELELVWRYLRYLHRGLVWRMSPPIFIFKRMILPRLFGFRGLPKKKKQ